MPSEIHKTALVDLAMVFLYYHKAESWSKLGRARLVGAGSEDTSI